MSKVEIPDDQGLRAQILETVAQRAIKGYVHYHEMESLTLPTGASQRVMDRQRGICNPSNLAATISIRSIPHGPYDDSDITDGLFEYSYEREGPGSRNGKLRTAFEHGLPIILFRQIAKGTYDVTLPVYVVGDDPEARKFLISLDGATEIPVSSEVERAYRERLVRQRMHQKAFRGLVLRAYETRCAICSLKYGNLLDAAHIIGDREADGHAATTNGLSLCKIHHAAYDANILGVDPEGVVHVGEPFLQDTDGPMLLHGIKEMHGRRVLQPTRRSDRPDPHRLEQRFNEFLGQSDSSAVA